MHTLCLTPNSGGGLGYVDSGARRLDSGEDDLSRRQMKPSCSTELVKTRFIRFVPQTTGRSLGPTPLVTI